METERERVVSKTVIEYLKSVKEKELLLFACPFDRFTHVRRLNNERREA